jgi:hypothetical protein
LPGIGINLPVKSGTKIKRMKLILSSISPLDNAIWITDVIFLKAAQRDFELDRVITEANAEIMRKTGLLEA